MVDGLAGSSVQMSNDTAWMTVWQFENSEVSPVVVSVAVAEMQWPGGITVGHCSEKLTSPVLPVVTVSDPR